MAKRMSRRELLRRSAALAATVGVVGCAESQGEDLPLDTAATDVDTAALPEPALVGLARGETVEQAVRAAVALAQGGMDFIQSGDTVLVKPNAVVSAGPPFNTNPEVVGAVVKLAFEHGAGRVLLVESTVCGMDTEEELESSGLAEAARSEGAEVIALSDEDALWADRDVSDSPLWGSFRVPAALIDGAHIINVPALKTHKLAKFTMCLKNFVGWLACDDRVRLHFDGDFHKRVAEISLGLRPSLCVLDATHALIGGGPLPTPDAVVAEEPPGIILASADPIAADALGLALLKYLGSTDPGIIEHGVFDQPVMAHAATLGIGVSGPDELSAVGWGVPELQDLLALID